MKTLLLIISLLATTALLSKDVIYDSTTQLLWQDSNDNKALSITYDEAKEYCSKLTIGEYKDFRIPTLFELQTIVDYKNYKPAILTGFKYTANQLYWSSTPFADDNHEVWLVNFTKGSRSVKAKYYDRNIRCVQK